MKAAVEFEATVRDKTGKGAARAARRAGQVPVEIYGNGQKNLQLSVDFSKLNGEYYRGGFMNKVVSFKVGGKDNFAIPRDIQLNPVSDKIEHADFIHVNDKSVVKVRIPVHFLNVEKSIGIKRGGALNIVKHDIEVMAPVASIPKFIEVDVMELDIGRSVHINDIKLPKDTTPSIKRNFTIASIAGRQKEEEEIPTTAPVAAGEVPATEAEAAAAAGAPGAPGAAPAAGAAPAKGAAPAAPAGDKAKK